MRILNSGTGFAGAACLALAFAISAPASAADDAQSSGKHFWSGGWSLTVGGDFYRQPRFTGSSKYIMSAQPLISFGRTGVAERFSSRNDNISFALMDMQDFRVGLTGEFLMARGGSQADGLKDVPWGGEIGGFMEFYPTDWFRLRGEARHGIRAHEGIVAEIAGDAFYDVTPAIRVSGGPRISAASRKYFDTYYGINAEESKASGLSAYDPDGGGLSSVGLGGAITWLTTDKITTTLYAEYEQLKGKAARSSLVSERGSRNQLTVGVSATYRFDFTLD
ncbi:MipA/OmpV family protein [Pseudochrobactrum sp. MP213Fo]|uniref:MipA/OmpV family protein n=1 Tax=Pseudochrobactrum sp. MP213Fo TaxID=3022250 RepID=UPI003B9E9C7A